MFNCQLDMIKVRTDITEAELLNIKSPELVFVIQTIKSMQRRMKEPDLIVEEYAVVHNTLADEFPEFFEKHPTIFVKTIRNESMDIIASTLFHKEQINLGLLTEEEFADKLATQFLPKNLKEESDRILKEQKNQKSKEGSSSLSINEFK